MHLDRLQSGRPVDAGDLTAFLENREPVVQLQHTPFSLPESHVGIVHDRRRTPVHLTLAGAAEGFRNPLGYLTDPLCQLLSHAVLQRAGRPLDQHLTGHNVIRKAAGNFADGQYGGL